MPLPLRQNHHFASLLQPAPDFLQLVYIILHLKNQGSYILKNRFRQCRARQAFVEVLLRRRLLVSGNALGEVQGGVVERVEVEEDEEEEMGERDRSFSTRYRCGFDFFCFAFALRVWGWRRCNDWEGLEAVEIPEGDG